MNITSGHVVLIRRGCVLVWAKQGNVVGMQGEGRGGLAEVMGRGSAGEGKGGRQRKAKKKLGKHSVREKSEEG